MSLVRSATTHAQRGTARVSPRARTCGGSLAIAKENNCEREKEGGGDGEKKRDTNVRIINEERYTQREKNRGCVSSRANARVSVVSADAAYVRVCVYLSVFKNERG